MVERTTKTVKIGDVKKMTLEPEAYGISALWENYKFIFRARYRNWTNRNDGIQLQPLTNKTWRQNYVGSIHWYPLIKFVWQKKHIPDFWYSFIKIPRVFWCFLTGLPGLPCGNRLWDGRMAMMAMMAMRQRRIPHFLRETWRAWRAKRAGCVDEMQRWERTSLKIAMWGWVKTLSPCSSHQSSWDLWMFIPPKMVCIGIDP